MKSPRYYVAVIDDNGRRSVLSHRDRTEWTKRTAEKHAADVWRRHGFMPYVIPAGESIHFCVEVTK